MAQTQDFRTNNDKVIKSFMNLLSSNEFGDFMNSITGLKFSNIVDLSANMYQNTDFLLCHDDRLEDRKVAFMIYLSSLTKKDGGALNLFDKEENVAKSLRPSFNTFLLFKVSKKSFHVVEEVVNDIQRIALTGWFHG